MIWYLVLFIILDIFSNDLIVKEGDIVILICNVSGVLKLMV